MAPRPASIIAALASWPDTLAASRRVSSWAGDPRLGSFATAGDAARLAIIDQEVLAVLAGRSDDPDATLSALAAVGPFLAGVARRWARSGMPKAKRDDAEADLVAAALDVLRSRPGLPAERAAQLAWHRWSTRRRTERSRRRRLVL